MAPQTPPAVVMVIALKKGNFSTITAKGTPPNPNLTALSRKTITICERLWRFIGLRQKLQLLFIKTYKNTLYLNRNSISYFSIVYFYKDRKIRCYKRLLGRKIKQYTPADFCKWEVCAKLVVECWYFLYNHLKLYYENAITSCFIAGEPFEVTQTINSVVEVQEIGLRTLQMYLLYFGA